MNKTLRTLKRPSVPTPPLSPDDDVELDLDPLVDGNALLALQDEEVGGNEGTEFMFESDDWDTDLKKSIAEGQAAREREHLQTAEDKGYRSPEELELTRKAVAAQAVKQGARYGAWRLLSILLTTATVLVLGGTYVLSGGAA